MKLSLIEYAVVVYPVLLDRPMLMLYEGDI